MSMTGISRLDYAPQVVDEWLEELCHDLQWREKPRAYLLLHETLHAIRDALSVTEATDLAAQLPVLIRGIYFEGWSPSSAPVTARDKADLRHRIEACFARDPLEDPDRAIAAVFGLLRRHVSGEAVDPTDGGCEPPASTVWH